MHSIGSNIASIIRQFRNVQVGDAVNSHPVCDILQIVFAKELRRLEYGGAFLSNRGAVRWPWANVSGAVDGHRL